MSTYKAVIFDWAGTTVDYGCFAPVQAFVEVFCHFGIEPTMEEVRKPMGMLKRDHIRTMLQMKRIFGLWKEKYGADWTEDDVEKLYSLFEEKLLGILDQFAEVKPYVLETIEELEKERYQDRFHNRLYRQDDGDRDRQSKGKRIRAGCMVQPGFHRKCGTSVPIYDLQKYGSIKDPVRERKIHRCRHG